MSDIERIKDAIRIEDYIARYVPSLKKAGTLYKASCPHHPDKTPSFVVNPESQTWRCYGACNDGGDVIAFAMKHHSLTFGEALEELARFANITLTPLNHEDKEKQVKKERLYALMEEACTYYQGQLFLAQGSEALLYLMGERGLSHEVIVSARLGYSVLSYDDIIRHLTRQGYSYHEMLQSGIIACKDKDETTVWDFFRNRVMIPIRDTRGRIVAFSGRAMDKDQTPKYLHNATNEIFEKSKIIHRMPLNRSTIGFETIDTVIAVEGTIDPVSALNCGIYNIASTLGTALTEEHIKLLCKGVKKLVLCFDNDVAGNAAMRKYAALYLHSAARLGVELLIMRPPHGKDPDDTFRERPHLWQPAVDAARPVVDVLIDLEMELFPANPTGLEKRQLVRRLMPVLKSDDPIITEDNLRKLAACIGITFETLKSYSIVVLPKPAKPVALIGTHLPTNEEWIVHALLVHDDDYWYERASAALDTITTDSLPYALAPLSLNDFIEKIPHIVIAQMVRLVNEKQRPLHETVEAYFRGGNNQEIYERLEATEGRSHILGGPGALTYDEFISAVFELRIARLKRDINNCKDEALIRECSLGIAVLSLGIEELV